MNWPWGELGLPGPAELPEIRGAYARRLKTTHPEEDPEGFQRLHAAYREASRQARQGLRETPEAPPAPPPEEQEEPRFADWDYERLFAEGEAEARETRRREAGRRRRKTLCAACAAILAVLFLISAGANLRTFWRDFSQRRSAVRWESQSLIWLEEDFGEPFVLVDEKNHLYAPASDPTLTFWALPDGERRPGGQPGYRTDYPHMRVMRAMMDFAEAWSLGLAFDGAGNGGSGRPGAAPGAYLFDLPLEGAEEAISALGALARELEGQDWNRVPAGADREEGTAEYRIFLCHNGLAFYDAVSTQNGGYDTDEVLARYKTAGSAYCRYIVEHSGLAAKHMGEDAYALLDWGTAELEDGHTFFLAAGLDKQSREPLVRYFMPAGGDAVFCVPEGKDITSLADLYRGFASLIEVEKVGRVMIWDHTFS